MATVKRRPATAHGGATLSLHLAMSTTSLLEPPQFVQYNHHSHYAFFLLGTSQHTSWDGPDTPLVSTSRKPDATITDRAIKAFMSPKATATKRSQMLSNHELFVGGYYITSVVTNFDPD
jgi:hypothetical protein